MLAGGCNESGNMKANRGKGGRECKLKGVALKFLKIKQTIVRGTPPWLCKAGHADLHSQRVSE